MAKALKGITKHSDGRYMWRFTLDGEKYCGYAKTAKEAEKALNNARYEAEHGTFIREDKMTVDDWFDIWISTYKSDCKDTSLEQYRKMYRKHIAPTFGKKKIKDIRAAHIQKFLNGLTDSHAQSTIDGIRNLMCGLFKRAYINGLIQRNPFDGVTTPKSAKKTEERKAISSDLETKFFEYAKRRKHYDIMRISSLTGMRIDEILGLMWDDVDFANKCVHVRHNLCRTPARGFYIETPKTAASLRDIPLTTEAAAILQARSPKVIPIDGGEFSKLVFHTWDGKPIHHGNVRAVMIEICEEMRADGYDMPDISPHILRHCFATRCIEKGMNPKTLQKILGHSSLAMTMDIYCSVMEETKRTELEAVAAFL